MTAEDLAREAEWEFRKLNQRLRRMLELLESKPSGPGPGKSQPSHLRLVVAADERKAA